MTTAFSIDLISGLGATALIEYLQVSMPGIGGALDFRFDKSVWGSMIQAVKGDLQKEERRNE